MARPSSVREMAKEILNPMYHRFIDIWLDTATKHEMQGVKVICMVCRNKGQKKFKPKKLNAIAIHTNALTVDSFKARYMTSHYKEMFGQEELKKIYESDLLKYRKLNELPCSTILNTHSLLMLEKWITLNDDPEYQSAMLRALRGLHSVIKVETGVPNSQTRTVHSWFSITDQIRAKPPDYNLEKMSLDPQNPRARAKTTQPYRKIRSSSLSQTYETIRTKELKQKELESKNHTAWVGNTNSLLSSYQENFMTQYSYKLDDAKHDYKTSQAIRLIPNFKVKMDI